MSGKVEFCENRHSCSHTSLWKWSVKELLPGIFIFLEQFDISSVQNIQVISSRKYEFVKIGVMKAVLYSTGVNKFASAFSKTFSPLGWYLVQAHKNLLSNSRVKKKKHPSYGRKRNYVYCVPWKFTTFGKWRTPWWSTTSHSTIFSLFFMYVLFN